MSLGTYALTTLAHLKEAMGVTHSTNDELLERGIDAVTSRFETETRRKLKARDYSYVATADAYDADNAILDGNDRDHLVLPQYPIVSLTTLRINETAITERSSIYGCGWVLDKKNGVVMLNCYLFSKGRRNIELVYNAGLTTVPDDLANACIEQALWSFKQSIPGGNLLGVASKALADGSISYTAKDLLPGVETVLENYKKRFAF